MKTPLEELVHDLATEREQLVGLQASLAAQQELFDARHFAEIAAIAESKAFVSQTEAEIRGADYSADNRHPAPGLSVKELTMLAYPEIKALEWAITNQHGNLLSLKRAAFEKVAEGLRLPFVTISKIPTVTIARDLSQAVAEIAARWQAEREADFRAAAERWIADEEQLASKPAEQLISGCEAE